MSETVVIESQVEETEGSEALMLFSQRLAISKQIDAWYEQHPQVYICNLNAVTALVSLGYKVGKWEFNSAEELDHYRMAAESEAKRGDELAARVAELEAVLREEFTGHPHTCNAWGNPPKGDCNCDAQFAVEVLNRARAASLKLHDAALLETVANKLCGDAEPPTANGWIKKMMTDEADKLRQEASNEQR